MMPCNPRCATSFKMAFVHLSKNKNSFPWSSRSLPRLVLSPVVKLLLNPSPVACHSKASYPETSVGRKGRYALFWRPAPGEEGGLLSKNHLLIVAHASGAFKGDFQGCAGREKEQNSTVSLTVILKSMMWWSDQCHLGCFKYSWSLVPGFVPISLRPVPAIG